MLSLAAWHCDELTFRHARAAVLADHLFGIAETFCNILLVTSFGLGLSENAS